MVCKLAHLGRTDHDLSIYLSIYLLRIIFFLSLTLRKDMRDLYSTAPTQEKHVLQMDHADYTGLTRQHELLRGGHSKQDQILLAKVARYIGFCVYRRSYLLWSTVII